MATPTVIYSKGQATVGNAITTSLVIPSGTNRGLLFLGIQRSANINISSIVFNGSENFVKLLDYPGSALCGITFWYLANPTATTANVVATGMGDYGVLHYICLKDIEQTSPLSVYGNVGGNSTTSSSLSITTTEANTIVISALASQVGSAFNVGGSQTALLEYKTSLYNHTLKSSYSVAPTAGSVTHTYSWTGTSYNDTWSISLKSPVSGPANLKSYNTNLKANIKSINTNLIANIKSLDTNV